MYSGSAHSHNLSADRMSGPPATVSSKIVCTVTLEKNSVAVADFKLGCRLHINMKQMTAIRVPLAVQTSFEGTKISQGGGDGFDKARRRDSDSSDDSDNDDSTKPPAKSQKTAAQTPSQIGGKKSPALSRAGSIKSTGSNASSRQGSFRKGKAPSKTPSKASSKDGNWVNEYGVLEVPLSDIAKKIGKGRGQKK